LEDLGLDAAPAVTQLIPLLKSREAGTPAAVADALGAIGKDAAPAIPKLVERLGEGELPRFSTELPVSDVGVHAAFALGRIGKDAVPLLVPCLTDKRSEVRSNAACALDLIGPDAEGAVAPLIELLKDRDWLVRQCAAEALGNIRSEPQQTIPALVESLRNDTNFNVRRVAAIALGEFRPATPAAVEGLIHALHDKKGDVQHEATQALAKLGAEAAPAVPSLSKMLRSREMYVEGHPGIFQPVAQSAARALGAIGPLAKEAMPAIIDVIGDLKGTFDVIGSTEDNREVRAEAAVAAARIDPQSDELVRALSRSLKEDDLIRNKVAVALALIGGRAKGAVAFLTDLAESDSRDALSCACAVVVIEPDNSSAVQTMVESMSRESGAVDDVDWTLLRTALAKGGARSRSAIPVLIKMVEDESLDQENAARALGSFGSDAEDAIPALLDLLDDRSESLRQAAVAALQQIASERSVPLLAALKNSDPVVRSGVVEVLGHFPCAVPLITERLNDLSARVRMAALLSLAKLEGSAAPAIPAVRRLLQEDSRTIREAAAFTLKKVEQVTTPQ
jgi:HEAT repeat protein